MTFLYPATLSEACALIGATHEQTGGGCSALIVRPREDFEILITNADGWTMTAPRSLLSRVLVCSYDGGDIVEERTFPTLLDAVLDIYGPIAGEVSA